MVIGTHLILEQHVLQIINLDLGSAALCHQTGSKAGREPQTLCALILGRHIPGPSLTNRTQGYCTASAPRCDSTPVCHSSLDLRARQPLQCLAVKHHSMHQ